MHQHSPRILLIDDNEHGLMARRTVLEQQGYTVEIATGGREGLAKFDEQPFDLVVTDYRMPDLHGLQVLHRIRKKNDIVPVVILCGYIEKLGLSEESTGANALLLSKGPKEEQDLIRVINRFRGRKEAQGLAGCASRQDDGCRHGTEVSFGEIPPPEPAGR
jgi:CheY-like chemotaxis protein